MMHAPKRLLQLLALLLLLPYSFAQETAGALHYSQALELAGSAPSIISATAQLTTAELQLAAAKSPMSTNVNLSVSQEWRVGEAEQSNPSATLGATSSFNIVPYGPAQDATNRAQNSVLKARMQLKETLATTIITMTDQFAAAQQAQEQVRVLQESLEIAQLRLQATLTRQAAGAANQSQVLQARINVTSAANDLSRGERDALTALTALSRTLGVAVTAVIGPAPSVTLPDGLDVTASIGGRTDVIAAGLDVHEAEIALAAARRNAGPTADARMSYSASFEEASAQLSATFDTRSFQPALAASLSTSSRAGSGTSQTIGASLGVSIPIDPAGSTAVQAAEISLTQATSNLTRTIATAQIEVQNLQRSLASAQAQLELTQLLVTQSTTALKQARTLLDLGSISILELKESEIALLQAQLQLMRSADAHNSALLALAAALGLDLLELLR